MATLNSPPSDSKFHRFPSLRRAVHRPRLPTLTFPPIPDDPLPLNFVGRRDFKVLRLNSSIHVQNRAISPPTEAFEPESLPAVEAADGRRILLSDVVVRRRREVFWRRKWTLLDIGTIGVVVATHLLTLLAPFQFNWPAFWVAISLYIVTGLFGITLSFHRNLSHRSFKLPKWLEYLFAYCGVQALQGNPIDWVSTHRYHHQFCDSERDPHSPIEGFWFSHMSWLFDTNSVVERCGEPNNVGDLQKQPFYRFIQSTYLLHPIALGALLYAMGGFPFIAWGMGVRIVWVYHVTWLVNSACHVWGNQAWKTGDLSRNNCKVEGLIKHNVFVGGGGWHCLHLGRDGTTTTMHSSSRPDMA
ncbi:palmitoyl-monogalactosyldiacylglycerol delta-7 desaturase, chloroplastic-like isoform X3 [Benincasa hispida]|uniref:palmitoyl-monogalactosyldiacylglycerol delta-7 desaturase, chloroplastic-like isoform X3 n=1 Tax=Benincasa hispida TaxID=102211 RepID=UPI001902BEC5|nr:palmitoyl-monogalactosyldiacylglycerol delta-7 desaturase, chloroplastic-like isoform X3 [Benincasa hispida]XP_038876848.1 palmitoyl-monogalactosyldiacylglycerol delta-7 desaturase, chloroplastic-like isoform X3 [Benincasa hispida]